jgi:hypothetical protein
MSDEYFPNCYSQQPLPIRSSSNIEKLPLAESNQNGSLPFFRHPAYFNPMTMKATGLLPGLGQTSVRLNTC